MLQEDVIRIKAEVNDMITRLKDELSSMPQEVTSEVASDLVAYLEARCPVKREGVIRVNRKVYAALAIDVEVEMRQADYERARHDKKMSDDDIVRAYVATLIDDTDHLNTPIKLKLRGDLAPVSGCVKNIGVNFDVKEPE